MTEIIIFIFSLFIKSFLLIEGFLFCCLMLIAFSFYRSLIKYIITPNENVEWNGAAFTDMHYSYNMDFCSIIFYNKFIEIIFNEGGHNLFQYMIGFFGRLIICILFLPITIGTIIFILISSTFDNAYDFEFIPIPTLMILVFPFFGYKYIIMAMNYFFIKLINKKYLIFKITHPNSTIRELNCKTLTNITSQF